MTSYIGLYYPFIHFKDEAWLKLAALYWDKMARIVPQGLTVHDSDTVKQLAEELDFIKNYSPAEEMYAVGGKFLKLLEQHESALRTRYNVLQRDQWPDVRDHVTLPLDPHEGNPKLAYIFDEKMSSELRSAFVETRLALPDSSGWVGMHPKLVDTYMTALAEEMAYRRMLHPLTDETLDHLTIVGWTVERLAQALLDVPMLHGPALTENEIEAHLAMVSLQLVIPKGIANVPIKKIITLRQQYGDELVRLQDSLHTFASTQEQLKGIENLQALRDHLEIEYTKKLRRELEDLKKQLRWLKIETITGAMNTSFEIPKVVVSAAALVGITALNPLVAASGAVAFAVLKFVGDKYKQNEKARQASPAAYLLRLERGLKPKELLSRVPEHAVKFGFPQ
jgi:hypothetical protein